MLAALKNHPMNRDVVVAACRSLRQLADDPHLQLRAEKLGALKLVVSIMATFYDNAAVLEAACSCLANLTTNVENKKAAAKLGAIEKTVDVLRAHFDNVTLQEARLQCHHSQRPACLHTRCMRRLRLAARSE